MGPQHPVSGYVECRSPVSFLLVFESAFCACAPNKGHMELLGDAFWQELDVVSDAALCLVFLRQELFATRCIEVNSY